MCCHLLLLLLLVGLGLFWVLPWPAALGIEVSAGGARARHRHSRHAGAVSAGPHRSRGAGLVGRAAEAATDVSREGLVRCQGERWTGTANGFRIRKGARVKVVDVRGATLVVEPIDGTAPAERGRPMSQRLPDSMPEDRKERGA